MFKNLFFKPRIPFDQTNNETKKIVSFVFVRLILEKKKKKKNPFLFLHPPAYIVKKSESNEKKKPTRTEKLLLFRHYTHFLSLSHTHTHSNAICRNERERERENGHKVEWNLSYLLNEQEILKIPFFFNFFILKAILSLLLVVIINNSSRNLDFSHNTLTNTLMLLHKCVVVFPPLSFYFFLFLRYPSFLAF